MNAQSPCSSGHGFHVAYFRGQTEAEGASGNTDQEQTEAEGASGNTDQEQIETSGNTYQMNAEVATSKFTKFNSDGHS